MRTGQVGLRTAALHHCKGSEAQAHRPNHQSGQVLLEWVIYGAAILVFWASSLSMAKHLLFQTAAETWSMIAARQALSKAHSVSPAEIRLSTKTRARSGQAKATTTSSKVKSSVALPESNAARSRSTLSSFGSLFSSF